MEKHSIKNEIKTFGFQVKKFPKRVNEAFDELTEKTGDSAGKRNYYGVSYMNNNEKIIYKALAEEKSSDESKKYNYEPFIIEGGEYLAETLKDWKKQTDCIKDIFQEMMHDDRVDTSKPCVEWYKDDNEMLCMMKAK